jgi:hypothetical protein
MARDISPATISCGWELNVFLNDFFIDSSDVIFHLCPHEMMDILAGTKIGV